MGKYHPHGDSAIYDTLVRLAQDFAMRYPLADGQGNFGSIDDDPAAAMRYTEARLSRIATEMLRDLDADTVDFTPNYDGSQQEPLVLPSRFPNLLVNGSPGIAVGMATNIPPHNLRETIAATIAFIENDEIDVEGLMKHMKGPDFPTGGIILGTSGIREAYRDGRGRVRLQARAHIEPLKQGKEAIVVTELPYMVKKGGDGGLMTKIADLVREKKLTGIANLEDHSDKRGMRLVIELKRDAIPKVVLNQLYKHTPMQTTFGVNMVALVDGVPQTLGLREAIEAYVRHQREVIVRRTKLELAEKERRAHILEGLLVALDNLDEVIKAIRASRDGDAARQALMDKFELSQVQAHAIVEMRLRQLTALESDKIRSEHKDIVERIKELREILGNEGPDDGPHQGRAPEIYDTYGDERRTEITHAEGELDMEDLIADQQMVITITKSGYIKSLPLATYRKQRRGGVGVTGMDMKDGDYIEHLFVCSTHDYLLFFTNRGKVYRSKVYELPEAAATAKGRALSNFLPLRETSAWRPSSTPATSPRAPYLVFATKNGPDQEDRVRRLQHADQGGRHHRHQDPRRRRACRRAKDQRRRRHHRGLALGQAARFNEAGAADGPRHRRRPRHERLAEGQPRARDGHRARRHRAARRDRERLRQAHADPRVPARIAGRRASRRSTDRQEGRRAGRPGRPRAPGARVHLPGRDGPAHRREGHLQPGPLPQGVRLMNLREDDTVSAVALVMESEAATAAWSQTSRSPTCRSRRRATAPRRTARATEQPPPLQERADDYSVCFNGITRERRWS